MYPFRPPGFPTSMPQRFMMNPITQMRPPMTLPTTQPQGLGGILSKLLGKGNVASNSLQGMSRMGFPVSRGMFGPGIPPGMGGMVNSGGSASGLSGILNNLSSGGIPGMLNNVQKAIGVAQQVGPMIQQYGPFIKNMPAMFKIMKEINNTSSTDDSEEKPAQEEENQEEESEIELEEDDFDEEFEEILLEDFEENVKESPNSKKKVANNKKTVNNKKAVNKKTEPTGISKPKLYI